MISVASDCEFMVSQPVAHPNIREVTVDQMRQQVMYFLSQEENVSALFPCINKRYSLDQGVAHISVNPGLRGCLRAQGSLDGLFATAKAPASELVGAEWRRPLFLYSVKYQDIGIPDNTLVPHQRESQTHWLLDRSQSCYFPIPVAQFFIRSLAFGTMRSGNGLTGAVGFIDIRPGQHLTIDGERVLGHGQWRWEMVRPRGPRESLFDTIRFEQIERKAYLAALNERRRSWFPRPQYSAW